MARVNQSLTAKPEEKFSVAIRSEALQSLIAKSTPNAQAAARLTGSLVSIVSASKELQACNPATVVAAALRGEGLGLMLGFGYYVVPYAGQAVFTIGYKGLIQMALAGGDVADMDCVEVREGEYVGRNRRTKRPEFDFSVYPTDEEAEKHPIVGYYAYIEKRDGFFRSEYMSLSTILDHAERYSQSFDRKQYDKLASGSLSPEDAERLRKKSPWYGSTDTMMRKTVIRRLLNSGYVTLNAIGAINDAIARDDESTTAAEALASFDVVNVDESTGEVREESVQSVPEKPETAEAAEKPKRGRKPAQDAPAAQDVAFVPAESGAAEDPDPVSSFFAN